MTSCQFNATLGGIGDFVVLSATAGHLAPEQGNVINGKVYVYYAQSYDSAVPPNVTAWEAGSGSYNIVSHVLHRTTITANSNDDLLPVDFPTPPVVDVYESPSNSLETLPSTDGGGYSNIRAFRTAGNFITVTADMVSMFDTSGNSRCANLVGQTCDLNVVGAGGLDVGPAQANKGYNYFAIYNPISRAIALLFSLDTNGNSPTMPAGYTFKRRIGWCPTDGSGFLRPFQQRNAAFTINFMGGRQVAVGGSGLVNFPLVGFVPPTAQKVRGFLNTNNNNAQVNDDSGNVVIGLNAAPPNSCIWPWEFTVFNSPTSLFYSCSSSGGSVSITGWEDNI